MADTVTIETVDPGSEPRLRGKTSLLTMLLIASNFVAALGFGALIYVDIGRRQEWAKAVFLRDLATLGLPVDDKESKLGTNPEAGTQPRYDLDPPLIRDAYKARGGKLTDKFMAVHENYKVHIRPGDLDQALLAKYFADASAGPPVASLQDEVRRLKNEFPGKVDAAAREVAGKAKKLTAVQKQELLRKILFPLCTAGWQAVKMDEKIGEQRDAKQDEEFLTAAAKRRMWYDVLQPLELFRPGEKVGPVDPAKKAGDAKQQQLVDRAAQLDEVTVGDLQKHFLKRCGDMLADHDWINKKLPRDNLEKRRCVAFLLLAASQVELPGADRGDQAPPPAANKKAGPKGKKKDPDGEDLVHFLQDQDQDQEQKVDEAKKAKDGQGKKEANQPAAKEERSRPQRAFAFPGTERRAEVVCGLRDFDQACEDLAVVTEILEKQTVQAIQRDLGTFEYPGGHASSLGFLGKYDMALHRIQDLAMLVERGERQYTEMKNAYDERAKLWQSRLGHEKDIIEKLFENRQRTRQLARDLKVLQDELFVAQVSLAGANAYNLYLANRLEELEKMKSKSKGGPGQ